MKIENDKRIGLIEELLKSRELKSKQEQGVKEGKINQEADKVEISKKADSKRIKEMVEKVPVVREEKVERLREAIEAKTYNVKGELVAKNLLKSHILETIL